SASPQSHPAVAPEREAAVRGEDVVREVLPRGEHLRPAGRTVAAEQVADEAGVRRGNTEGRRCQCCRNEKPQTCRHSSPPFPRPQILRLTLVRRRARTITRRR